MDAHKIICPLCRGKRTRTIHEVERPCFLCKGAGDVLYTTALAFKRWLGRTRLSSRPPKPR